MDNGNAPRRAVTPGLVAGGVIVFVGVVILLGNLGIMRPFDLWRLWPFLLIAAGIGKLADAESSQSRVWGGTLVLLGGLFALGNFGYIPFSFRTLWPLLIIFVGFNFLWSTTRRQADCGVSSTCWVNGFQVFGGCKQRVITEDFKGGEVLAVFGGYEIDLSGSKIAAPSAVLTANALFGGVKLRVPDSWRVRMDGVAIFGGYDDKTRTPSAAESAEVRYLIIKGTTAFGGVEVSN
jgi:predicted membrane protein